MTIDDWRARYDHLNAETDRLQAEVERLREDAARARWCEENKAWVIKLKHSGGVWVVIKGDQSWEHHDRNAAIDAARGTK